MTQATVPRHLGLILDGNRRWAKSHGKPTLEGHRQGAETFKSVSLAAFDSGVEYVTAYTFSSENWQRTEEEVGYLMKLLVKAVEKHLQTFHDANIKIVVLGRKEGLDKNVLAAIEKTEKLTAQNTRGTLGLCFNYGGMTELVDAVRIISSSVADNQSITEDTIANALYHPEIPPIDLIIRTSGEQRISGFMLARSEYAELYFTKTLWPDFDEQQLHEALSEFAQRKRRFGS